MGTLLLLAAAGCVQAPKECGQNVRRVVHLDLAGPGAIKTSPDFDFASYAVTAEIEKERANEPATLCYLVMDHDPLTKGPWAVDDVLDANVISFGAQESEKTQDAGFVLWAKGNYEVCGTGALPGDYKTFGCSGERKAEVYLEPIGFGRESPRYKIVVE